jgi:hypothetical protein
VRSDLADLRVVRVRDAAEGSPLFERLESDWLLLDWS